MLAISRRKVLAETVTDVLVERGNRDVALSAAQNTGAKFSEAGYIRLVKRSEGDDELAQVVGSRPEIPRQQFLKLLTTASNTVRLALEAANPQNAGMVRNVVAEVATAIQVKAAAASRDYAAAQAHVKSCGDRPARRKRRRGFCARGKVRRNRCRACHYLRIADRRRRAGNGDQDSEETILILAKSIGMAWTTTKAILLLCADKGGVPPQILEQCRMVFNKLKRETALQVVKFHQRRRMAEPI